MQSRYETMKEISSAIIVLAGAVTIAAGGGGGSDTGSFALLVGYGLMLAGTIAWGMTVFLDVLKNKPPSAHQWDSTKNSFLRWSIGVVRNGRASQSEKRDAFLERPARVIKRGRYLACVTARLARRLVGSYPLHAPFATFAGKHVGLSA